LMDKEIIFLIEDIDMYKEERGIFFEPYEFWTPGYKVKNWSQVINSFERKNEEYRYNRQILCDLVHKYKDDKATTRIWTKIDEFINEEKKKRQIR
ncbi:MAG: CDP-glycerol glycerophosphotransferase family protein, partial [Clostridium sp.]